MRCCTKKKSWDVNFSDALGSLWITYWLQIVSVGTFSGLIILGIRTKLVGIEIPLTSVEDKRSVVSVLYMFGFEKTVDCVYVGKPAIAFCCAFWAIFVSVIIDWFEQFRWILWSTVLFALMADVIILSRNSNWELLSVLTWSKLRYFGWTFSVLIEIGSKSCSLNLFRQKFKTALIIGFPDKLVNKSEMFSQKQRKAFILWFC